MSSKSTLEQHGALFLEERFYCETAKREFFAKIARKCMHEMYSLVTHLEFGGYRNK